MPFRWVADPIAEAGGVVLVVDVSRHARSVGFESAVLLSRGVWARLIGVGAGQEQRLVETLTAARARMSAPSRASEDGTALTFPLAVGTASAPVAAILDLERPNVTFMLWAEFTRRPADGSLRVRVVAEEEPRPAA